MYANMLQEVKVYELTSDNNLNFSVHIKSFLVTLLCTFVANTYNYRFIC